MNEYIHQEYLTYFKIIEGSPWNNINNKKNFSLSSKKTQKGKRDNSGYNVNCVSIINMSRQSKKYKKGKRDSYVNYLSIINMSKNLKSLFS